MKKIFAFALAVMLALLCACGAKEAEPEAAAPENEPEESPVAVLNDETPDENKEISPDECGCVSDAAEKSEDESIVSANYTMDEHTEYFSEIDSAEISEIFEKYEWTEEETCEGFCDYQISVDGFYCCYCSGCGELSCSGKIKHLSDEDNAELFAVVSKYLPPQDGSECVDCADDEN